MPPHNDIIDFENTVPIAEGRDQWVFQDPIDESKLIKVPRPSEKPRLLKRYAIWRYRRLRSWQREMNEYLALLARTGTHCDRIARFHGFCDTSKGPGILVEKIVGTGGNLAPTFAEFIKLHSADPDVLTALREDTVRFFDTLAQRRIDFHDCHSRNVLVTGIETPKLTIVDGLGTASVFPITQFSQRVFLHRANEGRKKLLRMIDTRLASHAG